MSKKSSKKVVAKKAPKVLIAEMSKADYAKIAAGKQKPATVGQFIRAKLLEGKLETDKIIAAVKKSFKQSKTKASDIYWNASQLRKTGLLN